MSPTEALNLDIDIINKLIDSMPSIEAHEQLMSLSVADFPTMKQEARNKMHKALNKQAKPIIIKEEEKALTSEDLAKLING